MRRALPKPRSGSSLHDLLRACLLPACLLQAIASGADSGPAQLADAARWKAEAARVTITRDTWGIAHVHGHTDADAVFGMIYTQCEDDFNRVETNYLTALGRLAEADGESALWTDLRQRLFLDPVQLQVEYKASPAWLRALMDAWADGLNFYLARHPAVRPRVLTRFEPWMALSFTEGSIGGDIERVDLARLADFYRQARGPAKIAPDPVPTAVSHIAPLPLADDPRQEPDGSNGFAIAPAITRSGHALLLINPHTSFFFRSELQMTSDEGLNAYGAVTWGQIFVYQGFNERAGWMHTSSNVDAIDEYLEMPAGDGGYTYRYGNETRTYSQVPITLSYTTAQGMKQRSFVTYASTHGPVVREEAGRWVAIQLMQRHVAALEQSYQRTKARSYAEFAKTMELMANSSNNTVYADADGTIAYWHGDFIPRRDVRFDFTQPVDGANPATDWHGLHTLAEVPQLKNPASGYLFNVNDSPWNGAGASSLRKADFPAYVEQGIETARGVHAARVLEAHKDFTPETLRAAAYDSYLPWFARTLPKLLAAWDRLAAGDPLKGRLSEEIASLRTWDDRWSKESVPTSLAVFWGDAVARPVAGEARRAGTPSEEFVATKVSDAALLNALELASDKLTADFGTWKTPWGEINRFERVNGAIVQPFSDTAPSLPVPFPSSQWGSLASFGARPYPGTKKWYGTGGNSFVAVVEFGPRVHAIAVTAGGESGHPESKHFNDQAQRYVDGNLREVWFYPDQLRGHVEKTYKPGD